MSNREATRPHAISEPLKGAAKVPFSRGSKVCDKDRLNRAEALQPQAEPFFLGSPPFYGAIFIKTDICAV